MDPLSEKPNRNGPAPADLLKLYPAPAAPPPKLHPSAGKWVEPLAALELRERIELHLATSKNKKILDVCSLIVAERELLFDPHDKDCHCWACNTVRKLREVCAMEPNEYLLAKQEAHAGRLRKEYGPLLAEVQWLRRRQKTFDAAISLLRYLTRYTAVPTLPEVVELVKEAKGVVAQADEDASIVGSKD
jgi:hypothetical protein